MMNKRIILLKTDIEKHVSDINSLSEKDRKLYNQIEVKIYLKIGVRSGNGEFETDNKIERLYYWREGEEDI